jgi:hypothetical protein
MALSIRLPNKQSARSAPSSQHKRSIAIPTALRTQTQPTQPRIAHTTIPRAAITPEIALDLVDYHMHTIETQLAYINSTVDTCLHLILWYFMASIVLWLIQRTNI